jgi:hypothetical protein
MRQIRAALDEPEYVLLEIALDSPLLAGITPAETRVLFIMFAEMDRDGRVYGVPSAVSAPTYYRALRRLVARGLVEKAGIAWRVVPGFARKAQAPGKSARRGGKQTQILKSD